MADVAAISWYRKQQHCFNIPCLDVFSSADIAKSEALAKECIRMWFIQPLSTTAVFYTKYQLIYAAFS
jgi:hypothetical protein